MCAEPRHPPGDEVIHQWAAARPDLDTSPMQVISPLKRTQQLLNSALEPIYESAPVTSAELDILIRLRHADKPLIARRIAERVTLSRAAISKTLAKLERRAFVERQPNPADRRAALITITPAGADVVDTMFPRQLAAEARLLAGLGPERPRVIDALNLLVQALEQGTGPDRA